MLTPKILTLLTVAVAVLAQDEEMESRMLEDQELEETREMLGNAEALRMLREEDEATQVRSLDDFEQQSRAARQSGVRAFLKGLFDETLSRNCQKAGNKAIPNTCNMYLSCRSRGYGKVKACSKGYRFDPVELKCRSSHKVTCRT